MYVDGEGWWATAVAAVIWKEKGLRKWSEKGWGGDWRKGRRRGHIYLEWDVGEIEDIDQASRWRERKVKKRAKCPLTVRRFGSSCDIGHTLGWWGWEVGNIRVGRRRSEKLGGPLVSGTSQPMTFATIL